ncbi:MAG TPA: PilZ domain-containing protein [Candidatus Acidoferrales bacterium]|nr:PilZ domain-containing protein [Candidatus Acidoferrales bacterium]
MKQGPRKISNELGIWNAARAAERYSSLRDLQVSYEGYSDTIVTRLPDISTRGMFINTSKHFPEGAVLSVGFRLARTGVEVQSRCEVRYCLDGVGVGVEFVDISAKAVRAIAEELHVVRNSPPENGKADSSWIEIRQKAARKKRNKRSKR